MKIEALLLEAAKCKVELNSAERILSETQEFKNVDKWQSELKNCRSRISDSLKHVTSTTRTFRAEFKESKTSAYFATGSLDAASLEQLARSLGATDEQIEACRRNPTWKVQIR